MRVLARVGAILLTLVGARVLTLAGATVLARVGAIGAMTHVAFLRAVNVGGRGLIKMTDLQKAFTAAGAENVRTVITSD